MLFSCKTKLSEKAVAEMLKPAIKLAIFSIVVGVLGLIVVILGYFLRHELEKILLFLCIFLLLFGIMYFAIIVKLKKDNKKRMDDEGIYEFYEDYLVIKSYKNGEQTGITKLYYRDVDKVKETKSVVFIYPNKSLAYPIMKDNLGQENLASLRKIFKLPAKN